MRQATKHSCCFVRRIMLRPAHVARFISIVAALSLATDACASILVSAFMSSRGPHHRRRTAVRQLGMMTSDHSKRDEETKRIGREISRSSFLSSLSAAALIASVPLPAKATSTDATASPSTASAVATEVHTEIATTTLSKDSKRLEQLEETISGFFSGGALTVTKTLVKYPLDTASVRLQMPSTKYSINNLPELFNGSYRGITAPLLSNIPAGAVFFAVKDAVKTSLKEQGMAKWMTTSLAVLAAQGPYWLLRNPSEVIKTRQQAGVEGYGEGTTIVDAFKLATDKERGGKGLRELYKGYWENIIYAYPADVVKFVCYESLSGGRKNVRPAQGAMYGAVSTAVAQFITTPLDVVRNRIMADDGEESAKSAKDDSYVDKLTMLAREEGLEGLFAGATPRVGKALLSGAIQFATYEETKQSINRFLEKKFNA